MAVRVQRTAGKKRRQPNKRRVGKEGEEGRMKDECRRREGRQLGLGGSDLGGAGQSWETHLEMTDSACAVGQSGRQKMWKHRARAESRAVWEVVVGFGWGEVEHELERDQDLQAGCLDK